MDALFEGEEVQEVLRESFYRPAQPAKVQPTKPPAKVQPKATPTSEEPRRAKRRRAKPADVDYQVICISLYDADLAALDAKVQTLKSAGHRKMSRSALIRFALDQVDLSKLPKSY
jgi:hypothetical protein